MVCKAFRVVVLQEVKTLYVPYPRCCQNQINELQSTVTTDFLEVRQNLLVAWNLHVGLLALNLEELSVLSYDIETKQLVFLTIS